MQGVVVVTECNLSSRYYPAWTYDDWRVSILVSSVLTRPILQVYSRHAGGGYQYQTYDIDYPTKTSTLPSARSKLKCLQLNLSPTTRISVNWSCTGITYLLIIDAGVWLANGTSGAMIWST